VVAQRLVQVHRLQDGRVEARQQLRRYDHELERVVGVTKPVEQSLVFVPGAPETLELWVSPRRRDDDLGRLGRQERFERGLLEQATLLVERHDHRLETILSM